MTDEKILELAVDAFCIDYDRLDGRFTKFARALLAAGASEGQACHKCGLQMTVNPHPEAGKPPHYLEVGCPKECIPCLVKNRHGWATRAMKASGEIAALRERIAGMEKIIARIPRDEQSMINFIGNNFSSMQPCDENGPVGDLADVTYSLSVHDLLSAFSWNDLDQDAIDAAIAKEKQG
ncbi:hypothetical protein [Caballeronia sp. GAFFF3]|uniref:hypothetical protein n=1 Tax=Caballeronia sp. GAFFF3 TaxID=2921759 RepID=UPI002027F051|nr:hypothetical protein [Caballeronia sp. GAFFF3]